MGEIARLALVRKATALAADITMELGDLISRNVAHGGELGFFGTLEIGLGALGGFTGHGDGREHGQRAIVAVELHEAILVQFP